MSSRRTVPALGLVAAGAVMAASQLVPWVGARGQFGPASPVATPLWDLAVGTDGSRAAFAASVGMLVVVGAIAVMVAGAWGSRTAATLGVLVSAGAGAGWLWREAAYRSPVRIAWGDVGPGPWLLAVGFVAAALLVVRLRTR